MMLKLGSVAAASLLAITTSNQVMAPASLTSDSVVVRVRSTGAEQIRVTGAIIADNDQSRHLKPSLTPLELRLPSTSVHAVFRSLDGDELAGEIFLLRDGKRKPRAAGNSGSVLMMYVGANGEAGITGLP